MTPLCLLQVRGPFFRAVAVDRLAVALSPPDAASAGRYHRPGQAALYMSPSSEWATIAVSGYMREDQRPRVILPLMVSEAFVLDQRDEEACRSLGIDRDLSNCSWRTALAAGGEPASWRNADIAREAGADGIVDRSRQIPGGWHVNLFRWNELGGPTVTICGDPVPIVLSDNTEKWSL
jgi:RES domain-containing protein